MGRMSKDKGARYERWVAEKLSEWSGIDLVRTPMSGGWVGEIGDIVPRDRGVEFLMSIECKKQECWDIRHVFGADGLMASPLTEWWYQTLDQTEKLEELIDQRVFPLMVFSRNRYPNYVAMDYPQGWQLMKNSLSLGNYHLSIHTGARDRAITCGVLVTTLDVFLEVYRYSAIVEECKG